MGTSYYAGLAIGVELTEEHLLGEKVGETNRGCDHSFHAGSTFCPTCGKKIEIVSTYVIRAPFAVEAKRTRWSDSVRAFLGQVEGSSFLDLKVVKVGHGWRGVHNETFILGKELTQLSLSYGDKLKVGSFDVDFGIVVARDKIAVSLKALGFTDPKVKLWVYGYGC